jgi:hypothetical protein
VKIITALKETDNITITKVRMSIELNIEIIEVLYDSNKKITK